MCRILGLFAVQMIAADAPNQTAAEASRPTLPSHLADVEVICNGTSHIGRLIVTRDGEVHLEHLEGEVGRRAKAAIRRAADPVPGWDNRTDPVRCVWCRLGPDAVLAEVHAPAVSLTITRHQLLPNR